MLRTLRRPGLWVFILSVFLLCFRPAAAFRTSWGGHDDDCYKAWLMTSLGAPSPLCHSGSYLPGIALLWLPSALFALAYHALGYAELFATVAVGVGLTSFAAWAVGVWAIVALLEKEGEERPLLLGAVFSLAVPVLYYATSRTALAHAGEFCLGALALYALRAGRTGLSIALAVWLAATRLNDVPFLLVIAGSLADEGRLKGLGQWRRRGLVWAGFAAIAVFAAVFLFDLIFVSGYNRVPLVWHLFRFRFERVFEVLYGSDWGLLWTGAFWLFCWIGGLARWRELTWAARASVLWMTSLFAFCCLWPGNGSDFAYRYLVGSYFGALILWREWKPSAFVKRLGYAVLGLNAFWLTYLTLAYFSRPRLRPHRSWIGWISPGLQIEAVDAFRDVTTYLMAFWRSALGITVSFFTRDTAAPPDFALASDMISDQRLKLTVGLTLAALALLGGLVPFLFKKETRG